MSRLIKTDDSVVNASSNPAFSAILEASLDRRGLLTAWAPRWRWAWLAASVSQLAQAANAASDRAAEPGLYRPAVLDG